LPGQTRYQSIADIESRLSYDPAALDALCDACRARLPGAWNLLLLGGSRIMISYLSPRSRREPTEEAGDLFRWLAEAVQRGASPFSYLKRAELKTLADMIALSLDANDGEEMGDAERSTLYVQIEIAKKALAALIPEAT